MATSPTGFFDDLLPLQGVKLTTANTQSDGTGDLVTLVNGVSGENTIIDRIIVQSISNSSPAMVNLFLSNVNGTDDNTADNTFLLRQFAIESFTASDTQPYFRIELSLSDIGETPIVIAPTKSLRAAQTIAQDTIIYVSGGRIVV